LILVWFRGMTFTFLSFLVDRILAQAGRGVNRCKGFVTYLKCIAGNLYFPNSQENFDSEQILMG